MGNISCKKQQTRVLNTAQANMPAPWILWVLQNSRQTTTTQDAKRGVESQFVTHNIPIVSIRHATGHVIRIALAVICIFLSLNIGHLISKV